MLMCSVWFRIILLWTAMVLACMCTSHQVVTICSYAMRACRDTMEGREGSGKKYTKGKRKDTRYVCSESAVIIYNFFIHFLLLEVCPNPHTIDTYTTSMTTSTIPNLLFHFLHIDLPNRKWDRTGQFLVFQANNSTLLVLLNPLCCHI
jgi:hypothetical protein